MRVVCVCVSVCACGALSGRCVRAEHVLPERALRRCVRAELFQEARGVCVRRSFRKHEVRRCVRAELFQEARGCKLTCFSGASEALLN